LNDKTDEDKHAKNQLTSDVRWRHCWYACRKHSTLRSLLLVCCAESLKHSLLTVRVDVCMCTV